jgi:hypothetical protein
VDFALGLHHAADGAQRGRLAGAVGAEDGGDAAFFDREVEAVQDLGGSVLGVQAAHVEQACHQASVPR